MRCRFSLLLCLLVAVALGWIIGSVEAPTITEQKNAGVSKMHLALDAANTGRRDMLVASGTRTGDEAWITCELHSAAIEAHPHSTATIRNLPSQRARLQLILIHSGQVTENLPTAVERA
jgi:hypothetical protein